MNENKELTSQEMVKRTNQYIEEIGLDDEILGLETTQDKVLYYQNYIDPTNIFKGVLVLPNYYYIKLANLLCNTTERLKLFYDKFYDAEGNLTEQFREFRRYLLDNRENTEEYLGVMQKMIKCQLYDELYVVLKELWLEPFDKWIFDKMVDMIHKGLTAQHIYSWFTLGKNIKSLITYPMNTIRLMLD
jgi:hypothetical protein